MKRWLLVFAIAVLVMGCANSPSAKPSFGGSEPETDVDTPELHEIKSRAGIADCPEPDSREPMAEDLPTDRLPCLGGGRDVVLSQLRSNPTVINIWASDCKPCVDELPVLQKASHDYGDAVTFIGIDMADDDPEAALKLAHKTGVRYPLIADPGGTLRRAFKTRGLPETIFVDGSGRITHTHHGAFNSDEQFRESVREHLGVSDD